MQINKVRDFLTLPVWYKARLIASKTQSNLIDPLLIPRAQKRKNNNGPFLTAIPHPTVGIGHTLSEYNAGRIFAKKLGIPYAHCPLPEPWETFLNFKDNQVSVPELLKKGYRWCPLPRLPTKFGSQELLQLSQQLNRKAREKPTIFHVGYGQNAYDQSATEMELRKAYHIGISRLKGNSGSEVRRDVELCVGPLKKPSFYSVSVHETPHRKRTVKSVYKLRDLRKKGFVNVIIHVRSKSPTDGLVKSGKSSNSYKNRFLAIEYYEKIGKQILKELSEKRIHFIIFGQGPTEQYTTLKSLGDVTFHLKSNPYETFFNMTLADVLIISRSSFSFKAGMLCKGLKYAPVPWWHKVPENPDWRSVPLND